MSCSPFVEHFITSHKKNRAGPGYIADLETFKLTPTAASARLRLPFLTVSFRPINACHLPPDRHSLRLFRQPPHTHTLTHSHSHSHSRTNRCSQRFFTVLAKSIREFTIMIIVPAFAISLVHDYYRREPGARRKQAALPRTLASAEQQRPGGAEKCCSFAATRSNVSLDPLCSSIQRVPREVQYQRVLRRFRSLFQIFRRPSPGDEMLTRSRARLSSPLLFDAHTLAPVLAASR